MASFLNRVFNRAENAVGIQRPQPQVNVAQLHQALQQAHQNRQAGLLQRYSPGNVLGGIGEGIQRTFTPIGQDLARSVPQVIETVRHPFSDASYHPGSFADKQIFGDRPVQNIQAGVGSNLAQHHNKALAAAYGLGQIINDVPLVKGVGKTGETAAKELTPFLKTLDKALVIGKKTPYDTREIVKLRKAQNSIVPTINDSSAARQQLRQAVVNKLYGQGGHAKLGKAPLTIAKDRQFHLVLGGPASGKTGVVDPLVQAHNARLIDSDEAKKLLGDVNQAGALHQESDHVANSLFTHAAKNGENIVQALVGKSPEKIKGIIDQMHQLGYDTHVHYNHLDPKLAAQRAIGRLAQTGRFVDPNYVLNEVGLRPKATYDILKANEKIKSYKAYDNNVPEGQTPKLIESGLRQGPGAASRPPGKLPAGSPQSNAQVVNNRLTVGGKSGRQNIGAETQEAISGQHEVRSTQALQDAAVANADAQGLDNTIQAAHDAMARPLGKIDDKDVALAHQAIERADATGRFQDASAIHDALSEHLVKQGQTIQAASLLYQRSPQGLLYKGLRDIKKSGTEVTPEIKNKLETLTEQIKKAINDREKVQAIGQFRKEINKHIPQSKAQGALSVWKAGLLSGTKTQGGNFLSNATFGGLKSASNPLSAAVDKAISLRTGERTKTVTLRGIGRGAKQGAKEGVNTLKTGIDVRGFEDGKYEHYAELNFKNPVIQKVFGNPSNLVFRGMSAADQPFYYSALKNNLYDIAKADGLNKGLKGKALVEHMNKMVESPTTKMAETAKLAAQKAVLGQDSAVARSFAKFARAHPSAQVLAPFVKVPTNFLTRTIDYTPIGPVKTAVHQIRAGKFDQRALSDAIGEGITGTAAIYLGAELANHGLLSGQYPSGDQKEAARWKAQGIQPNSIRVGNTWVSLNYLGPVGLLFGAGKDYQNAHVNGDNATIASVAGLGKNLTGQSFLTGFSGFANAINDPQRSAKSFINSEVGSTVPSWLNDIANVGDTKQRETNTPGDSVKSRLPVARNSLPVKQDVYGNELDQRTNRVGVAVNPLRPSDAISRPVSDEVGRLHSVDPNNKDLQVTPTPVGKAQAFDGVKVKLNDSQAHELQKQIGSATQDAWGKIIQTPEYKALSDPDKAKALNNARQDVTATVNRQYAAANSLGQYSQGFTGKASKLTADQNSILQNGFNSSNYLGGATGKAPSLSPEASKVLDTVAAFDTTKKSKYLADPRNSFQYNLASYQNDVLNGKLDAVQQFTKLKNLQKQQVTSNYSRDVNELYGLSKADLANYNAKTPLSKSVIDDLVKMDSEVAAQNGTTPKYKNGVLSGGTSGRKHSVGFRLPKAPRAKVAAAPKGAKKAKIAKLAFKAPKAATQKKIKFTA